MFDIWTVIRFVHVLGAIIWVGGQLTITLVVLPPVRERLTTADRAEVLRAVGKRFALITMTVFVPVQIATGVLLAWHYGVTWASLLQPGYGRILVMKLVLFTGVMVAATLHGIAQSRGQAERARAMSLASLVGSLGVVLLATWLAVG
ncbi:MULTISPECIES: hypothetical protein [Mycolicibacterium]|jgi:uncharacterized membrane protein|uniref:Copper resistance protein D domain-containing protein n=1 Tax=Mycolicibacterium austroafricanum TaxID=39687 RepID=A0ABT8HG76_MYCAO|nr:MULTISPECIES: hypothetical protein [Mycolicibacterium]MDN4519764.1 hypothetical protein [Mycolicibacterium austroafricanum]UJL28012.1 hypothetical protein HZU38_24530 [Mycolicibacterium vanbaalenii]WND59807.1 hypothetical protein QQA43_18145 [Mycolicibacterium vanbaalenii]